MEFLEKHRTAIFLLVLAASAFISLYNLGKPDLIDWDESWLTAAAAQSMEHGDPFRLYLNGSPWYEKPPPAMWLYQISFSLLGFTSFAARLPSALCGIALLCTVFLFSRKYLGTRAALFTWAVLVSTYAFVGGPDSMPWAHGIRSASTELPMMLFGMASLFALFLALNEKGKGWMLYASAVLLALCFYMRGLAVAPFAVSGALYFAWRAYQERKRLQEYAKLCAIWLGIAALIALPYVISNLLSDPENFIAGIFGRFSSDIVRLPQQPRMLTLIASAALTLAPWLVLYPLAARWSLKNSSRKGQKGEALALLLISCASAIAFFLFIPAFPWYLFPLIVPASMLCGAWLDAFFGKFDGVGKSLLFVLFAFAAVIFVAIVLLPVHNTVRGERVVVDKISAATDGSTARVLLMDSTMRKAYYNVNGALQEGDYYYLEMLPEGFNYSVITPEEICEAAHSRKPGFYWVAVQDESCVAAAGAQAFGKIEDNVLIKANTTLYYLPAQNP